MKEMSHNQKQKLYAVIMVIVLAVSICSIVWIEKDMRKDFERTVKEMVLEKEEDFKNHDYTLNELLYEIVSYNNTRYRDTSGEALKQIEKVVFENYDRNNPLYRDLFIDKQNKEEKTAS